MFKYLLILITILYSFPVVCNAQENPTEASLLWRISRKDVPKPGYLYGTFHLLCKEDVLISDRLKAAIQACDEIFFEVDMDDPGVAMKLMSGMKMKDSLALDDILTKAEYERINQFFKDSLATNIHSFRNYKPFFFASLLITKFLDCKNKSGVDQEILKLARKFKKPIGGLETVEFQASVFDLIPYQTQARELLRSLDSLEEGRVMFQKMIHSYKAQDLAAMQGMTDMEDFGFAPAKEMLLNQRNRNWVVEINRILTNKSVLFAVGAGHLTGEQGLINLLRKEGFTVTPIRN